MKHKEKEEGYAYKGNDLFAPEFKRDKPVRHPSKDEDKPMTTYDELTAQGITIYEDEASLYRDLVDAGVEIDHHESDLYFPVNNQTTAILKRYPETARLARMFVDQKTKTYWYDLPFAYLPFWENRS